MREDFKVGIGPAGGPEMIARALGRRLWALAQEGEEYAVVLAVDNDLHYFVQCLVQPDEGCWIEAISDYYLPPRPLLSDAQVAGLEALGFRKPTRRKPNWWQRRPQPVDWAEVAQLLLATLVGPYQVTDGDVLELKIFPS